MIAIIFYILHRMDAHWIVWLLFGVWAFCRMVYWMLKIYHAFFKDLDKDSNAG